MGTYREKKMGCLVVAALGIALFPMPTRAGTAPSPQSRLELGAAWYPEQWPEARWDADLSLMEQAHFTVVRIGEFAWSRMEPTEGHFELDWVERAVRIAEKHRIRVVMSTPTDAPPAWMTQKYPETLGMDANGHWREHGNRRQFSYASPLYRKFCVEIATHLAERFGHDPNVIGWQIGNELTDESFDPATRKQFQEFLKAKYGTLDELNRRWTTTYWSQTYTSWDQIPMEDTRGNPGLLLEHKHFVTATWQSFVHAQIAAIQAKADVHQFITTNIGGLGWSDNWDHYVLNRELSLASWDDYVGQGHLDVTRNGFMNDFVRGWKRENFWVMETQPGSVNWAGVSNALDRGETRAMAWQNVGHGADAILYWQWRSALNGQEQYHGAIVGPDGKPLPIYEEIKELGEDFVKASPAIAGTQPVADVAMLVDYDSRWAMEFQPQTKDWDELQVLLGYYRVLSAGGRTVDVVSPWTDLSKYKMVVAPGLNVIPEALAKNLTAFVQKGGQLILGPRSGLKDEFNALDVHRQPGPLAEALGGRVEQYYPLERSIPVGDGGASIWAEKLSTSAPDTRVLMRYGKSNGWLDDQPAVISRGGLTYIGAVLAERLLHQVLDPLLQTTQKPPELFEGKVPGDIEVCERRGEGKDIFVVINHSRNETIRLKLTAPMKDWLHGDDVRDLQLGTEGVAVLQKNAR